MTEFKPYGPYKIRSTRQPSARILEFEDFWSSNRKLGRLKKRKGVYVFVIRPCGSTRYIPYYVGQATRNFGKEVFAPHKLNRYAQSYASFKRCSVALLFIVSPQNRGPLNTKHIQQIERKLIELGTTVNPEIRNKVGTKQPRWSIRGVIRSKTKRASKAAKTMVQAFAL